MTEHIVRLHIVPFSPEILQALLPSSAAASARDISFHHLQTFPENNYGYLELPSMEAEKVKKKLNGSILKGQKIRIEEARPRKRRLENLDQTPEKEPIEKTGSAPQSAKRSRKDKSVVTGYELAPHRKVKRGWTEPKPEKSRKSSNAASNIASSKYTDKEELLFRTRVPPNKAPSAKEVRKGGKKKGTGTTVHEFEKSKIQPSFLRSDDETSGQQTATEYVDGKGWINDSGALVEEEDGRLSEKKRKAKQSRVTEVEGPSEGENLSNQLNAASSTTEDSTPELNTTDDDTAGQFPATSDSRNGLTPTSLVQEDDTSSEGSKNSSTSDSESESISISAPSSAEVRFSAEPSVDNATSAEDSEAPGIAVHPLEALFKRPSKTTSQDVAKPSLEVQTSFSFFEADNDTAEVPGTPWNSQDFRARGMRSAAPTPDTAAPSRQSSYWESTGSGSSSEPEKVEAEGLSQDITPSKERRAATGTPSDFTKWFWEHRGDSNRAWKRRRREVSKEQRQREKRQAGRRVG